MKKPNIVFLICHDLGTHLGCYGVHSESSPNLDALADRSIRFARNFCTAPQCSPSRAAITTGRYPHSNGMFGLANLEFRWRLHPDEKCVQNYLKEAGYATALVGIQHLTDRIPDLGFDTAEPFHAPCGEIADCAIARLDQLASGEKPFYLEIGFFEPHRNFSFGGVTPDDPENVWVPPYLPDCEEVRKDLAGIQAAIHTVDGAIGRIVAALDATGRADETLLVFTTDHGIAFPRAKCTLYDPGIHTALLIRTPDRTGSGTVHGEMISNVDLLPTFLEYCGLPVPEKIQGRSFAPLLLGEPYTPRTEVFAEKTFHSYYDPMRCIRTEHYKYIRNFDCNFAVEIPSDIHIGEAVRNRDLLRACVGDKHPFAELYDLEADPWEGTNLSGRSEFMAIEKDLRERLFRWMEETGDPLLEGPVPSPYYRASIQGKDRI